MNTKHFIIASICLLFTSMGFAQNKLFDKYADMDGVTSVYISKAMFLMLSSVTDVTIKPNVTGVDLEKMKGKIESMQLVSTEKQDKIAQMRKEFSQLITTQHEELMRVKEDNTNVKIYTLMQGDLVKELIMLVDENDTFTAILLNGSFTLKDIQSIAGEK